MKVCIARLPLPLSLQITSERERAGENERQMCRLPDVMMKEIDWSLSKDRGDVQRIAWRTNQSKILILRGSISKQIFIFFVFRLVRVDERKTSLALEWPDDEWNGSERRRRRRRWLAAEATYLASTKKLQFFFSLPLLFFSSLFAELLIQWRTRIIE